MDKITYFNHADRTEMLTNFFLGNRWIHTGHKDSIFLSNHSVTATVAVTVASCNGPRVMIRRTEKRLK